MSISTAIAELGAFVAPEVCGFRRPLPWQDAVIPMEHLTWSETRAWLKNNAHRFSDPERLVAEFCWNHPEAAKWSADPGHWIHNMARDMARTSNP